MSDFAVRLVEQLRSLSSTSLHLTHKDREVTKALRQLPWMRQNVELAVLTRYLTVNGGSVFSDLLSSLNVFVEVPEEAAGENRAISRNHDPTSLGSKWILLLLLFYLIDFLQRGRDAQTLSDAQIEASVEASRCAVNILKSVGVTMDSLDAKLYFAISRLYTLTDRLAELCEVLVVAFHSAVLRSADMCIATIMNQLVHAYLALGDYTSAIQFTTVAKFPEQTIRSTPQIVRCMFNLGRIHALQLHYPEALEYFQSALNKLPPNPRYAFGFKLLCYKHSIVVELLMGHIPSIQIFRSPRGLYFRPKLTAYESLVLAVRNGDNPGFQSIVRQYSQIFRTDQTLHLVERLHHAIQRVTLKRINLAYARISLQDIAKQIGLQNITDTESTVAKAIVDGVICGFIDANNHCLVSQAPGDGKSSGAPIAEVFSKRIMFCADMYFDAKRALQYPEEENLKARAAEAEERRKQLAEERKRVEDDDVCFEDEDDY